MRADAAKESAWPPKIQEFITAMQSEIVVPFPGSPEPTPGTIGPVFEYRYYTVRAGQMPGIPAALGRRAPGADQAVAADAGRHGGVRHRECLRPHLGVQEPRAPRRDPQQGARGRGSGRLRVAAIRSSRRTTRSCCRPSSRRSSRGASRRRSGVLSSVVESTAVVLVGGCFHCLI